MYGIQWEFGKYMWRIKYCSFKWLIKKITFPLTKSSNFVCNYNFQKSDSSSNRISILMQKNEAERLMNQQKIVILNFLI